MSDTSNNEGVLRKRVCINSDNKVWSLIPDIISISDSSIGSEYKNDDFDALSCKIACYDANSLHSDSTVLYNVQESDYSRTSNINLETSSLKEVAVFHRDIDSFSINDSISPHSSSPLSNRKKVLKCQTIKKRHIGNVKENSVLNSNNIAIESAIVKSPNYNKVKQKIPDKFKTSVERKFLKFGVNNGRRVSCQLKQIKLDSFFRTNVKVLNNQHGDSDVMSKKASVDAVKFDRVPRSFMSAGNHDFPRSARVSVKKDNVSASPNRNLSASSHSPRKNVDTAFSVPRTQSNKTCQRIIPNHKIVAGTHFAVDAFSYGEIPMVNHYFLTHFHSDHYSGLKKTFKKNLFCSKITADLCTSRLGVNSKYINILHVDETKEIEGVEVTALDANHCPGALMLVFTLPNGKTLLHTGDFRASPVMESYAIFWNTDIHTIYLDTTYCNPRYDFPTQDQSIEMALYILRQKKVALEKVGKKFSSVLIVCGTYTIGKEKFFLGLARRVGCSIWACPEKDRVLQTVESRSFSRLPPQSCQLHIVPMRDLTHEKLQSYLDSLQEAFSEIVAFKPSGWENGKNSTVEKDSVTIHGIPYSEHSSFSEMIRFVKFLKPKQVIPTVDISGGVKAVQKFFPCPLIYKEETQYQSRLTDYFSIPSRQHAAAVT